MLVAPSEPTVLKTLGKVSLQTERKGADFLWSARPVGLVGVQRKEFPGDFLASVTDGRLSTELGQMSALDVAILVLEGRDTWTTEGELVHPFGQRWTKSAHRRYLCSVQARGVWVQTTNDIEDTRCCLEDLVAWSQAPSHNATRSRPAAKRDAWGRIDDRGYLIHLVQGLPKVGPELAARIVDHFAPQPPLQLAVSEEELRAVHGLGKVKARQIVKIFEDRQ